MDLFDFFFPDQAQAHHLRRIASKNSTNRAPTRIDAPGTQDNLRADVNFLTLVVTALLRRLAETQSASPADIQDIIDEIDALDGVADGGLDPGVLRGMLGVIKQAPSELDENTSEFEIDTTPRYRKR